MVARIVAGKVGRVSYILQAVLFAVILNLLPGTADKRSYYIRISFGWYAAKTFDCSASDKIEYHSFNTVRHTVSNGNRIATELGYL